MDHFDKNEVYIWIQLSLDTNNSLHKDKQLLAFKMIDPIAILYISKNNNQERQIIEPM